MKKWIVVLCLYFLVVGVFFGFGYLIEREIKDDIVVQTNSDDLKELENKQLEDIKELKLQSEKELAETKRLESTPEYYRCLGIFEQFFEDLEYKDYEGAMNLLNVDFREYKGIKTLDDFKQYVEKHNLDEVSANINSYKKIEDDVIRYKCDVVLISRHFDISDYNREHMNDLINSSNVKYIEATVSIYSDGKYDIAFEGFVKKGKGSNIKVLDEPNIKIIIREIYYTFDGIRLSLDIQNKGEISLNAGTMFDSIQALDYYDNPVWADELSDSIEYEIAKGETLNVSVTIDVTSFYPNSIKFVFKNGMGGRPIEVELPR